MSENGRQERPKHFMMRLRCVGANCGKLLGVVDESGRLVIESKRSGWWIAVKLERGTVICKKCGTKIHYDSEAIAVISASAPALSEE